jgi:holdfast attachment protein HfaA
MSRLRPLPGLALLCAISSGIPASAQVLAVAPSWVQTGFNGAAGTVTQPYDPMTRDANGNRLVVNGEMVGNGAPGVAQRVSALEAGCSVFAAGAGTSASPTAIGNLSQIQVNGSWNTVVATVTQTNSGPVSAVVTNR